MWLIAKGQCIIAVHVKFRAFKEIQNNVLKKQDKLQGHTPYLFYSFVTLWPTCFKVFGSSSGAMLGFYSDSFIFTDGTE